MLIYIGFDKNNKVEFVSKKILNKLDYGVYFEIYHKENIDLEKLDNDTNLIDYDLSRYEIKSHHNAHFFLKLNNNLSKLTMIVFNFFNSVYGNPIENENLLRSHFTECLSTFELIHSTFDICIIVIATICLNLNLKSKICFNLPGGAGKTHAIDWLGSLFKNKILITTPTAKAAIHYKFNTVRTNHSTFKLNHQNMCSSWTFYKESVFIFDEASMISTDVINSLKYVSRNKQIFLIGDFAQLGPVLAKGIKDLPDLRIINASEDIFLPRFKCIKFVRLLTLIRKRILCEKFLPDINEIKALTALFKTETNQDVFNKFLIESEYDFIINMAKIKNLIPNNSLCNHFKTNSFKELDMKIAPHLPIISSTNKSVKLTHDEINKQLGAFKQANRLPACFFIQRDSSENREFMDKLTRHMFNSKLLHIGNCTNTVMEGSRVLCKQNESASFVYNGLSGVVVSVVNNNFKVVRNIVISKKRKNQQINKNICVYEGDFKLKVFIYDTTLKRIIEIKSKTELILDKHALKTFYIQSNYCVTLHQLQGFTVDAGKIYSFDDVLTRNILISFYVLVSRGKCFEDVVLSEKIIQRLIDKLFA